MGEQISFLSNDICAVLPLKRQNESYSSRPYQCIFLLALSTFIGPIPDRSRRSKYVIGGKCHRQGEGLTESSGPEKAVLVYGRLRVERERDKG